MQREEAGLDGEGGEEGEEEPESAPLWQAAAPRWISVGEVKVERLARVRALTSAPRAMMPTSISSEPTAV